MLTHDNTAPAALYLKDFVPSKTVPAGYKISAEELGEILSSPDRLNHKNLTYYFHEIDFDNDTVTCLSKEYIAFPHLFGEKSILGKVFFPKSSLDQIDNLYLKKLEEFLNDWNNEDNLLGEGFQEGYLMLSKVSDTPFKTKLGHLDSSSEVVIWIF